MNRFGPKKNHTRVLAILFVCILMGAFLWKPARYMDSIYRGLLLFAVSVLPAMFPFFFFSRLLTSLGMAEDIAKYTKKPVAYGFGAPEIGGYLFIMSLLSGYPVGAKLIADCYDAELIDERGAKALVSFTSTSGPLFVLGTVGQGMFHSTNVGVILLVSHYLGAIMNGFLFRKKYTPSPLSALSSSTDSILSDALTSAIRSVLIVGGYIAIFNMVISLGFDLKIIPTVGNLFASFGVNSSAVNGFLAGLIEVTKGSKLLSECGVSYKITTPLTVALISFGGCSVTLQSLTFLSRAKVKAGYYLLTKLTHALFSAGFATILCLLIG